MSFNLQSPNTKNNNSQNINFEGVRQLLGSESVKVFLKRTKTLGDVVINKRNPDQTLTPVTVSLVRTLSGKKGDKESKIIFSLFEKGYEKSASVAELDAKELGLAEVKYKNLVNVYPLSGNNIFSRSVNQLIKVYDEGIKVLYLVSHEGDKFQGIGSKLIDTAVAFSQKLGLNGKVFLEAENKIESQYLKTGSKYYGKMLGKTPTRFYYNYGFLSDETTNAIVKNTKGEIKTDGMFLYLPKAIAERVTSSISEIKNLMK